MEGGILDRSAKRSEKYSKDVINCIVCPVPIDLYTYQVKVVPRSVLKKRKKLHALPRHDSRPGGTKMIH